MKKYFLYPLMGLLFVNICYATDIELNWFDGNTQLSSGAQSCAYGDKFALPSTPAARPGYIFTGWHIKAVHAPTDCGILNYVDNDNIRLRYKMYTSLSGGYYGGNPSSYGITLNSGEFVVAAEDASDYTRPGKLFWGKTRCSTVTGDNVEREWELWAKTGWLKTDPANNGGANCWVQLTGAGDWDDNIDYSSGPSCKVVPKTNLWTYFGNFNSASECETNCAAYFSMNFQSSSNSGHKVRAFALTTTAQTTPTPRTGTCGFD